MTRYFRSAVLILALLVPSIVFAGDGSPNEWTTTDTVLQASYSVLHVIDWAQTLQIADQPDKYSEVNPILGKHPSRGRVNAYMAVSGVLHPIISYVLPQPYRKYWLGGTLAIKVGFVANSYHIGLSSRF